MIIKFDGFKTNGIVYGKKMTMNELKEKYMAIRDVGLAEKNIVELFCRSYQYETHPNEEEIQVDFVIDTDTDRIYQPRY